MISIILLTGIIFHSALGYNPQHNRYNELQILGGSCYPRDTCCTLNETIEDNLWFGRTCECGEHCIRHETCCIDSKYAGIEYFPQVNSIAMCQKVQTTNIIALMVSTCSVRWQESRLNEKCTNPQVGLDDPLSVVPVTSLASRTSYKNFYCAWCNDDADSTILWNFELKLPPGAGSLSNTDGVNNSAPQKMKFNVATNSWEVPVMDQETKEERFQKVKLKFSVPDELRKIVKPCHPRLISDCKPSLRNSILHYKCLAYYSPIKVLKFNSHAPVEYRNIHCALCNEVDIKTSKISCLVKATVKKNKPPLSFAMLLDVNTRDGDIVGKVKPPCKEKELYDPFFKKCRSMKCALPGYVMKGGACVESDKV
ncbi:uncharacterized protein TNCT_320941 [Trichonephila clavata]|uniref:Uncharacterized protein n=1 Tax=Trichonephila clavata TaxID=2740835 RepID=A0A8X6LZC3_TRICU|nr:uncharacterized protein TNCT_320941 [Trichonephila clavata]